VVIVTNSLLPDRHALAVGEGSERIVFLQTPSAPLGALLPAVQQRLLMEGVRDLAAGLIEDNEEKGPPLMQQQQRLRKQINSILLPLEQDDKFSLSSRNQDYNIMKRYSPVKVLSGALVRSSMNIYTANLNYGTTKTKSNSIPNANDIYKVTDPKWKKAYIRAHDGLPSVDTVIAADLNLRDLYRNQVQEKLDDASAEWYSTNCDLNEFRGLLIDATVSFDLWLDRISEKDVKEAIQAAALEGKELQLFEPFSTGFLPESSK
jgi:hypothetical protein